MPQPTWDAHHTSLRVAWKSSCKQSRSGSVVSALHLETDPSSALRHVTLVLERINHK